MLLFLIFFLCSLSTIYSNSIETMIEDIINSKNKVSKNEILEISKLNLNDSNIYILKGLVENDGDLSKEYFETYLNDIPNGKYSVLAKLKLGEYYYASGSYIQASAWYKDIVFNYSYSIYHKSAINYFLNSLSVSNQLDSAKFYTKLLEKKYPKLKFNDKFHEDYSFNKKINTEKRDYSIEIGAYEKYSEALNYKSVLSAEGFLGRIEEIVINNKKMFSLRVGYYNNYEKVEMQRKRIYSRTGLNNLAIIELN